MIYKDKNKLNKIYNFLREIKSKFNDNFFIYTHGSFVKKYINYITDIDIVFKMKNKTLEQSLPNIIDYLHNNKKIVLVNLKTVLVESKYFVEKKIKLDIENELYRRWNPEEIISGVKIDKEGTFYYLSDLVNKCVLEDSNFININFLYQLEEKIYVPISFTIRDKSKKKAISEEHEILQSYNLEYQTQNYTKAYKRINTFSHILLNFFELTDKNKSDLLTIINNYEINIYNINLISSIKTQVSLVGIIDNYTLNLITLINNLYKISESNKIRKKLVSIKKSKLNYLEKLEEIKIILNNFEKTSNKKFKPIVDKNFKIISNIQKSLHRKTKKKTRNTK